MTFERNPSHPGYADAVVTLSKGTRSTVVRVSDAGDYVTLRCEVRSKGEPLLVMQAYCAGSGCHDLDNFYIVSANTLKVLLTPVPGTT
jgi:hypothetical protein